MATKIGDILRITLCGTIFTEEFCNVFFYVVESLTGTELDLPTTAGAIEDDIVEPLLPFQTNNLTWNRILVENVTNGVDFADVSINRPGSETTTQALPSFNAFQVRFGRSSKITRNGYKRFAGITEFSVDGQELISSNLTALNGIVATWGVVTVPGTDGGTMDLIIVGRNPNGSLDLTRTQKPAQIATLARITSQNSRKS